MKIRLLKNFILKKCTSPSETLFKGREWAVNRIKTSLSGTPLNCSYKSAFSNSVTELIYP